MVQQRKKLVLSVSIATEILCTGALNSGSLIFQHRCPAASLTTSMSVCEASGVLVSLYYEASSVLVSLYYEASSVLVSLYYEVKGVHASLYCEVRGIHVSLYYEIRGGHVSLEGRFLHSNPTGPSHTPCLLCWPGKPRCFIWQDTASAGGPHSWISNSWFPAVRNVTLPGPELWGSEIHCLCSGDVVCVDFTAAVIRSWRLWSRISYP